MTEWIVLNVANVTVKGLTQLEATHLRSVCVRRPHQMAAGSRPSGHTRAGCSGSAQQVAHEQWI